MEVISFSENFVGLQPSVSSDDVFDGLHTDNGMGMRSTGAEKQGRVFGRNKPAVRTAAHGGAKHESQGPEAGGEFVPRHVVWRRDSQEWGQQFVLVGHE